MKILLAVNGNHDLASTVFNRWCGTESLGAYLGHLNPSCMKAFGTHTFYEGEGVEPTPPPPMISKTLDPTNFNSFGKPLGLSMRGKKSW